MTETSAAKVRQAWRLRAPVSRMAPLKENAMIRLACLSLVFLLSVKTCSLSGSAASLPQSKLALTTVNDF